MNPIMENIKNLGRIWRMAKITVREEFLGTRLGIFWEVFRTAIFFTIYSFFYMFIRGHKTAGATPALLGLFSALLAWNLISTVINQTPRVYSRNKILVNTIKFPLSIIPTFDIVAKFIIHLVTIAIVVVIFAIFKHLSFGFFIVLYYYLCLFALLEGLMFTLSLVCSISNDAYKFWQVITRVFIYINPVFWSVDILPVSSTVKKIIMLNPFVYIFEGFRHVLANEGGIRLDWYFVYFWVATMVILAIGIMFQKKLRRVLPDVL
jgi:ABC-type polysaccharide/polyol phosphate export permease